MKHYLGVKRRRQLTKDVNQKDSQLEAGQGVVHNQSLWMIQELATSRVVNKETSLTKVVKAHLDRV
jgi:hypothetical protein